MLKQRQLNINLDLLVSHLGQPEKQVGNEYFWQCPYCKDSGRDNLKFNAEKGILWCFGNYEHAPKMLKEIIKNNKGKIEFKTSKSTIDNTERYKRFFTIPKQLEFKYYMLESNQTLLKQPLRLNFLLKKRGINALTVKEVKLGVDLNKKKWVIPTFQYSTERSNIILGFEYRPLNLSKDGLTREKGAPTGLAMINSYKPTTEVLAIVEGYFDGYALYQHLREVKQLKYYHIVTPSNGVQSLLKYISQVDLSKYKRAYLYLDNDDVGNTVAEKIIEKYPTKFIRIKTECGCKDFNDHYLKCIKQAKKGKKNDN